MDFRKQTKFISVNEVVVRLRYIEEADGSNMFAVIVVAKSYQSATYEM
jgi:hypothetical protein